MKIVAFNVAEDAVVEGVHQVLVKGELAIFHFENVVLSAGLSLKTRWLGREGCGAGVHRRDDPGGRVEEVGLHLDISSRVLIHLVDFLNRIDRHVLD